MEAGDIFEYSSLGDGDAFRLVHLQPSDNLVSGLECSLKNTTLAEYRHDIADHYIAISYVWGDANNRCTVMVDGKRLNITASLECALRHIRDHRRVLHVWADGICINQKDNNDRNQQVSLMGDIYSTAEHTIIFLGLSSPRCDNVMQWMGSDVVSHESGGITYPIPFDHQFETVVEDEILSRPWFTRVWILQELVLSRDPWIQCGCYRVRWGVFYRTVMREFFKGWSPNSRSTLESMTQSRKNYGATDKISTQHFEKSQAEALLEVLSQRRGCKLSDPRDMIYAHLGIASAAARMAIPIDYNKSLPEVYGHIARLFINWMGIDKTLSLVERLPLEQRKVALPSWVPDWTIAPYSPDKDYISDMSSPLHEPDILNRVTWAAPYALVFEGVSYGSIHTVLPRSVWPVGVEREYLETQSSDFYHTSGSCFKSKEGDDFPKLRKAYLDFIMNHFEQWVSRSDNGFIKARKALQNLVEKRGDRDVEHGLDAQGFVTGPEVFHSHELEKILWESRMREIARIHGPEVEPSREALHEESDHLDSRQLQSFVFLWLKIALSCSCNQTKQVAILDQGVLVIVPILAQPGDIVIAPGIVTRKGNTAIIVRPFESEFGQKEQELVVNDLMAKHQTFDLGLNSSQVRNCKFVASVDWRDIWARSWYFGVNALNEAGVPEIFALH